MDDENRDRPQPLQFRLTTALGLMAVTSVLFGTLRWLGVPAHVSMLLLVVLLVSAVVAVALVVVIAHVDDDEP